MRVLLQGPNRDPELEKEYKTTLSWVHQEFGEIPTLLEDQYHFWSRHSGHSRGGLLMTKMKDRNTPRKQSVPWSVALDSMRSVHNTGSIIRTSDAFGFTSVYLGGYTPDSPKALKKAAMGAETWITQEKILNLADFLTTQKAQGISIIGLELDDSAQSLYEFNFPESGILVLGNEERGLSEMVRCQCEKLVYIPMYGRKNSLNVSCAFAIAAGILRQNMEKSYF